VTRLLSIRVLSITLLVAGLGLAALAAGCYSPNYGDGNLACGPGGECPSGYSCVDGFCRLGEPDAASPDPDPDSGADPDPDSGPRGTPPVDLVIVAGGGGHGAAGNRTITITIGQPAAMPPLGLVTTTESK
jgi:hypothetical protein